jgi:putative copper resistance protein D
VPKIRKLSIATIVALIVAAVIGTITGLLIGHAADPLVLVDPGPVIRWGIPIVKGLFYLSLATALGSLFLAAFALGDKSPELQRTLNIAAIGAALWTLFGFMNLLFTFASVSGTGISLDNAYGQNLWMFITQIQLGQYLGMNLAAGAILTVCALAVRKLSWVAGLVALGFAGLVPLALTGHAAGTANHGMAVNSTGMHLVGVSLWVGGLVALLLISTPANTATLLRRYSTLALVAFGLVAVSGIAAAWIRLGSWSNLFSSYGVLIVLKSLGLIVLGGFGALYRMRLIASVEREAKGMRVRLTISELVVMGATAGVAAALARTAPPIEQVIANPTQDRPCLAGDRCVCDRGIPVWRSTLSQARRQVANRSNRLVDSRHADPDLGHLRPDQRVSGIPIQRPHDRPHDLGDGRSGAVGAWCAGHPDFTRGREASR